MDVKRSVSLVWLSVLPSLYAEGLIPKETLLEDAEPLEGGDFEKLLGHRKHALKGFVRPLFFSLLCFAFKLMSMKRFALLCDPTTSLPHLRS